MAAGAFQSWPVAVADVAAAVLHATQKHAAFARAVCLRLVVTAVKEAVHAVADQARFQCLGKLHAASMALEAALELLFE